MSRPRSVASPTLWDQVRVEFGYSEAADRRAAHVLAQFLTAPPCDAPAVLADAARCLQGVPVLVVGAAAGAPAAVRRAPAHWRVVAADGATCAALEGGRTPDLIVTDLDGDLESEVKSARAGSRVFVHAHGDNEETLRAWVPRFPATQLAGTCQVHPPPPLINPGGFTDGDRACYLAHALGASRLHLAGFDLDGPIGPYAGHYDPATKLPKLRWAGRFLRELESHGAVIERGVP